MTNFYYENSLARIHINIRNILEDSIKPFSNRLSKSWNDSNIGSLIDDIFDNLTQFVEKRQVSRDELNKNAVFDEFINLLISYINSSIFAYFKENSLFENPIIPTFDSCNYAFKNIFLNEIYS